VAEPVGWQNYRDLLASDEFWLSFKNAFTLGIANAFKMVIALLVAVCIHRCRSERLQYVYRLLFVIPMVIPPLVVALIWRSFFFEATNGYLNRLLSAAHLYPVLNALAPFFGWGDAFAGGAKPAWLGDPRLLMTSVIIWGFPWISSLAILTHLAKLQGISKDVYEAADIDGITWWSKFTRIELPLITGSIYLMLVFTIIGTIMDAGMIIALAGFEGGPGGKVDVPALFMLRKAFIDQKMGYACAVGLVLSIIVMSLQKLSTTVRNWETLRPWQQTSLRYGALLFGLYLLYAGSYLPVGVILVLLGLPWTWMSDRREHLAGRLAGTGDPDAGARAAERRMRRAEQPLLQRPASRGFHPAAREQTCHHRGGALAVSAAPLPDAHRQRQNQRAVLQPARHPHPARALGQLGLRLAHGHPHPGQQRVHLLLLHRAHAGPGRAGRLLLRPPAHADVRVPVERACCCS
jgi:ABC-type sugar transport system permease subunit